MRWVKLSTLGLEWKDTLMIPRKLLQHAFVILTLFLSFTISSSFADESARSGTFKGLNKHDTSGSVTLVQTPDGPVIEFGDDFSFDGAPDPKVALGEDGKYDPFGRL